MVTENRWFEESYYLARKVWSAFAEWVSERPDVDFSPATLLVLTARGQIEASAPKRAFELLEAAMELGERLSQEDGFRREFLARVSAVKDALNKADPDGWAPLEVARFEIDVKAMTNLELVEKSWDLKEKLGQFEARAARIVAARTPKPRKNTQRRDWDTSWQTRMGYASASA